MASLVHSSTVSLQPRGITNSSILLASNIRGTFTAPGVGLLLVPVIAWNRGALASRLFLLPCWTFSSRQLFPFYEMGQTVDSGVVIKISSSQMLSLQIGRKRCLILLLFFWLKLSWQKNKSEAPKCWITDKVNDRSSSDLHVLWEKESGIFPLTFKTISGNYRPSLNFVLIDIKEVVQK